MAQHVGALRPAVCVHGETVGHDSVAYGRGADGGPRSAEAAAYPPRMNKAALAEALLSACGAGSDYDAGAGASAPRTLRVQGAEDA
eukprot:5859629-Pleurochrysis_carterae.AAC.2